MKTNPLSTMRLPITIFILALVCLAKTNASAHHSCADVTDIKSVSKEKIANSGISEFAVIKTTFDDSEKRIESSPGYLLHVLHQFSYRSVEARHFPETLFTLYTYSSSDDRLAIHKYLNHYIATTIGLMIIYPFHSFW